MIRPRRICACGDDSGINGKPRRMNAEKIQRECALRYSGRVQRPRLADATVRRAHANITPRLA